MPKYPLYLTCPDPGKTTGLALLLATDTDIELVATAAVLYDPLNYLTPITTMAQWLKDHPGRHRFVGESFHVRPEEFRADTTPLQVIDQMEVWIRDEDPYDEVVWHQPVGGKMMITDAVLKRMGLFRRGKNARHMNDGIRHGVTHLTDVLRHRPTCRLAFPPGTRFPRR